MNSGAGDLDGGRCRQVGRRRSSPSTSKPEVDPRRIWVGQLRHQTPVNQRQVATDRRMVEVMATWWGRPSTTMTSDLVCRVVSVRRSSNTYGQWRQVVVQLPVFVVVVDVETLRALEVTVTSHRDCLFMSNFISSASDRKRRKTKLNNHTIQHNEQKTSTDFRTYSLNPICQITSISMVRQIERAVTKSIRTTEKAWTKGYCQSHILCLFAP